MIVIAQQIDLLIDELKPRPQVLVAWQALAAVAAGGSILLAISFATAISLNKLAEARATLETQLSQLTDVTASLTQSATLVADPALVARVAALETERAQRTALAEVVTRSIDRDEGGYSSYLQQLAIDHDPALWLTSIQIGDGGKRVELEGKALEPSDLPRFLAQLATRARFSGQRFGGFEMTPDESGTLAFKISGPAKDRS